MASFRLKFEQGLRARGIAITHDLAEPADAILVIAGTKSLVPLMRARRRGIRVVQRLDGVNWVQRVRWAGLKYTLRAEYGNFMLSRIRNHFADRVIYQSHFIRQWWEDWYGVAPVPATVIHNGVDLQTYTPAGTSTLPQGWKRMLLLEGSLAGGLNAGLFHAVRLAQALSHKYAIEVAVAGSVDPGTREKVHQLLKDSDSATPALFKPTVKFLGTMPRAEVPSLARSSHLMYCAEVNPPCPNSVIESMACGLPIIGFDSGSLKELVPPEAGCIVPYGADPWRLQTPDISALASATEKLLEQPEPARREARKHAEEAFGLDQMVESYLKVLLED